MEFNSWPLDPVSAAALVLRVIDEIDEIDASDEELRDALLCDLLAAAWGSPWAQNQ